ncbi:TPA: hypothetical protein ACF2DR_001730 [Clostridium perfringens]
MENRFREISEKLNNTSNKGALERFIVNIINTNVYIRKFTLIMDYIQDVLDCENTLEYIYVDELPCNIKGLEEDIISVLEDEYNVKVTLDSRDGKTKGIFIENVPVIKEVLAKILELDTKEICESCTVEYVDRSNIYGRSFYNNFTEENYKVLIYNDFDEYLNDLVDLAECSFVTGRDIGNEHYMIVLKSLD